MGSLSPKGVKEHVESLQVHDLISSDLAGRVGAFDGGLWLGLSNRDNDQGFFPVRIYGSRDRGFCCVFRGHGQPADLPLEEWNIREIPAVPETVSIGRLLKTLQERRTEICVVIDEPAAFHDYSVSFLAYLIWDPVHMYNAVVNGWKDVEHQITFDVRQPKTQAFSLERLRKFCQEHPYVDVIRYTTFFHQFTLVFDELAREKFVDWYGYSASVSPYILDKFEKEVGYKFRPEFIIDQGYHNNQYRIPSKEYRDFQAFQIREVRALVRKFVDITHEYGKEAMMFLSSTASRRLGWTPSSALSATAPRCA